LIIRVRGLLKRGYFMEPGRLDGIVLAQGRPLPDVEIQISTKEGDPSLSTRSDESGLFSISGLSRGPTYLSTHKQDYVQQLIKVNLDEQPLVIHLEKGAILRGTILCEGFRGPSEIILRLFEEGQPKRLIPRRPDPQHPCEFEFRQLAVGTYQISFNSNFFDLAEPRTLKIDSAREYEIQLTLIPLAKPRSVTWVIPDIPGVQT
jgi:hypothetical protein